MTTRSTSAPSNAGPKLVAWVNQMAELCQPDSVVWCDGSQAE